MSWTNVHEIFFRASTIVIRQKENYFWLRQASCSFVSSSRDSVCHRWWVEVPRTNCVGYAWRRKGSSFGKWWLVAGWRTPKSGFAGEIGTSENSLLKLPWVFGIGTDNVRNLLMLKLVEMAEVGLELELRRYFEQINYNFWWTFLNITEFEWLKKMPHI